MATSATGAAEGAQMGATMQDHTHELVRWPASPLLRGQTLGYRGFRFGVLGTRRRLMVPDGVVKVMVGFGDLVRVVDAVVPHHATHAASMVNPVRTRAAVGEHTGSLYGVTVLLTPIAAYRLFAVPLNEWGEQPLDPADLLGAEAARLAERLAECDGWESRFALLERIILTRLAFGPAVSPEVLWVWQRLRSDAGRVRVEQLASAVGWSRRHLERRFREQVGTTPKALAQVCRLQAALHRLDTGWSVARAAAETGYHDQPHFDRTFKGMMGCTPGQFRRYRAAADPSDSRDFLPDQVTSVLLQDPRGCASRYRLAKEKHLRRAPRPAGMLAARAPLPAVPQAAEPSSAHGGKVPDDDPGPTTTATRTERRAQTLPHR
ncbi:hypothetical protein BIV23_31295 [Streptomyces monashensis]|uniref:HTH araC/xylS-type domain-containing protein n=2 Tax=Streptomyces monashensis TaxID=1678012 RepID=A0A1S2PUW4_9ACTN|nr:hypothetical protein BIV23_31295 [Streptomyces monashensis]